MDFVILDVDDDVDVPLNLGTPFLATSQALIDVSNGKMTLRVGDEEVAFALSDALKHSLNSNDSWFYLDATDSLADEYAQGLLHRKPFSEPLDDHQEGDISSLPKENETEVQMHTK